MSSSQVDSKSVLSVFLTFCVLSLRGSPVLLGTSSKLVSKPLPGSDSQHLSVFYVLLLCLSLTVFTAMGALR